MNTTMPSAIILPIQKLADNDADSGQCLIKRLATAVQRSKRSPDLNQGDQVAAFSQHLR